MSTSNPVKLIQNIPQLPRTRSIAASDLQLWESLLDHRIQHFKEILCLVTIRKHTRIVPRVEIRLVVSAEHRYCHVLLLLVESNELDQVVCVCLPPISSTIAAADTADQAAVAFVVVGFHVAWGAPRVGIDEEVRVVLESCLGKIHLARIVAVPGVVERPGWGCWARAKNRALRCGLDEVSDDGQGADVLVEECLGDFLLVVVGETCGTVVWTEGCG